MEQYIRDAPSGHLIKTINEVGTDKVLSAAIPILKPWTMEPPAWNQIPRKCADGFPDVFRLG